MFFHVAERFRNRQRKCVAAERFRNRQRNRVAADSEIGSDGGVHIYIYIYIYIYIFFWVFTLETVFMLETLKVFLFWGCLPRVESELVARNNVVVLEGSPLPLQSYDYIQLEYQGTQ